MFLVSAGLLAGFIDAIAGGGGLIALPAMSLVLGVGVHAIGSNKIVATTAALIALVIYSRKTKVRWKEAILFSALVLAGSFLGSFLSPHFPRAVFHWLLFLVCPLILFVVWRKDAWIRHAHPEEVHDPSQIWKVALCGVACGIYDGAFGPGGGTFMFLSLLFVARMEIFPALAASKLANTASAGSSLLGYSLQGYVHPHEGGIMAIGIAVGAVLGTKMALMGAEKIMRPVLTLVCALLLFRILRS